LLGFNFKETFYYAPAQNSRESRSSVNFIFDPLFLPNKASAQARADFNTSAELIRNLEDSPVLRSEKREVFTRGAKKHPCAMERRSTMKRKGNDSTKEICTLRNFT